MRTLLQGAALAAGLVGGQAIAAHAQQAGDAVQTARAPSLQDQVAAQSRLIDQQNLRIQQLQDQLNELSSVLSNRVDRVEAQTEGGRVVATNPGPRLEGPNARNSLQFVGAVQATFGTVDMDNAGSSAPVLHGGTEIKRARIGLQGTAFSDFNYAVEVELAQSGNVSAAARDLWVQYNGFRPVSFTIGNMKPQTGLEASFSDRSNAQTFIEGSMMTSMITAPGTRYIGLRASTGGSHWSSSLGLFGDDVNNNNVSVPNEEGFGVHGRLTYVPIAAATSLLHFGVSGYQREVATGRATSSSDPLVSQLRVRAQPENTIDSARLIDTGNLSFADEVNLVALEAAGFRGPVGFQAEWARMNVEQLSGRPDLTFDGMYVSANWFITGESRVYDARTGVFTRMSPKVSMNPSQGAYGAWEVAARWSTLDLNSDPNALIGGALAGVRGGEETNYTLGLNWYWNPYFRLMLNYVRADVDNRTNSLPGIGGNEGATADLVSLRVQQEW